MKTFIKNLPVKKKIFLIIGLNLFFLLISGIISYSGLTKLNNIKEEISTNSKALQHQQSADMMHDALRGDCLNAMVTSKTDYDGMNAVKADLKEHSKTFRDEIKELKKLEVSKNIKNAVLKVEKPLMAYISSAEFLVDAALQKTFNKESAFGVKITSDFADSFSNLEGKMEQLSELIAKESSVTEKEGDAYAAQIKLTLVVLVVSIFIIAILISVFIANTIVSPIKTTQEVLLQLSAGENVNTIEVESKDEIGSMVEAINSVVNNMNNVKEFVAEVGQGNFDTEISIFNNNGEIYTSLNHMRDSLKQTTEDEKKRNWATEGLAKFGDILRANDQRLEDLADNIISNLVRYLNANQGGLFIVNDNDSKDVHLELMACYAWNKKKYLHMRIEEGEGLVGQAWQENDTLYITDVPEHFVKITSGLGDANPKSFLIVPLTVNDQTFGVIEIASFNFFEQYHIDFVNKLAESIASTLSTAKTNERTRTLLEQSQQQQEEMRAQEEEMRQNMEEMAATQEEMQRKEGQMHEMLEKMRQQEEEMRQNMEEMEATQEQMEYQGRTIAEKNAETQSILDGVNAAMATIEFTPDGYVRDANANFLNTMKVSLADIHGQHHSNFVPNHIKNSADYAHFWSDLASGKSNQGEVERLNGLGETVWLNAIYSPIKDVAGNVTKVIKFATDITKSKEIEAKYNELANK